MRFTILLSLLLVGFSGCKRNHDSNVVLDPSKDQDVLSQYFAAATVGVVSVGDKLMYVLNSPISEEVSDDLLQGVIKLSPDVSGKVTLTNKTILTFIPDTLLQPNTTYTVRLNLKPILGAHFNEITYIIQTVKQDLMVDFKGIEILEDRSQNLLLSVSVADQVDINALKSCFNFPKEDIEISPSGTFVFDVNIKLPKGKRAATLEFDGSKIGSETKGSILIPTDQNNAFEVGTTYNDPTNNELLVFMTDLIDAEKDNSGLITVNGDNASFSIKNNIIKVFLSESMTENEVSIKISKGIRSKSGKVLEEDYSIGVTVETETPSLSFMFDGHYFPSNDEFKIPIKAKNLKEIRIQVVEIKQENVLQYLTWQNLNYQDYYSLRMFGKPIFDKNVALVQGLRDKEGFMVYGIDLNGQVKQNPGSIYFISMDYAPSQTTLSCVNTISEQDISEGIPDKNYYNYVNDRYRQNYYYDDYDWRENKNPCTLSYYLNKEPVKQLLICSDYNMFVKKAGNKYHFAVNDLQNVAPVSGAKLSGYNMQGLLVGNTTTSAQGFASLENLNEDITVVSLEKNGQKTYLSVNENDSNPLTEFDTDSERSNFETQFYIYTDRDVWRPGDSIYIDLMVNSSQISIPSGAPITLKFYNPDHLLIDKKITSLRISDNKIYSFVLGTSASAKTGMYKAVIEVGPKVLSKKIQIETIKPNTIETKFDIIDGVKNEIFSDNFKGNAYIKFLTGFAVPNAKVSIAGRTYGLEKPFKIFGDFQFGKTQTNDPPQTFEIFQGTTDDSGKINIDSDFDLTSLGRPLTLNIETETTLAQGGTNKEGRNYKVFPFKTFIGTKKIDGRGWYGNYTFEDDALINLVSVTDHGIKNKTKTNYQWKLYNNLHSWWVDKYRLRSSGYFLRDEYWKEVDAGSGVFTTEGSLKFPKGKLKKGAYKVEITDTASGHVTDAFFTVYDGKETIPDKQPYIISIETDKDQYKAGESVIVKLPDIKKGRALISIEKGNQVVEMVWHDLEKGQSISMTTDQNWSPNVYIHVSIIQPYKNVENDLPLRLYGIKYVEMDGENGKIKPVIDMVETMESNKKYDISIKESMGKEMEYTLAIIDEGLLNITGFQTPNPYTYFNGKFPLLVRTWDIYQSLIGYFKGKFAGIISVGGDNAYHPDAVPEVNRFKPLAMHLGPFKLGNKQSNTHTISIPNYIGKLRVMVVACNDQSFGNQEKYIQVKNPIMVQSQLPRSLNMTDKVQLPLTILKDDKQINTVELSAKVDPSFIQIVKPSYTLNVSGKDQMTQNITAEVLKKAGKTAIDFDISGRNKTMHESTDIAIHYPNAYESASQIHEIKPGETKTINMNPHGFLDAYTATASIGGLKIPDFIKYADELIQYPYGCLEQTTSIAFSQLYLDKVLKLSPFQNRERSEHLQAAINKIRRFQNSDGSFNYWDDGHYDAWADIYAGYFLIEAQSLNVITKSEILKKWLDKSHSTAENWSFKGASNVDVYESESFIQAFRLYVLSKGNKPAKSAMNRFSSSNKSLNPMVWWLLAGAYQSAGLESSSLELMKKAENYQGNAEKFYLYEFGSVARNLAIIVDVLSQSKISQDKKASYYDYFLNAINGKEWLSTQTMGFAFIAAYHYFNKSFQYNATLKYALSGDGVSGNYERTASEMLTFPFKGSNKKSFNIKNNGTESVYVYISERFISENLVTGPASSQLDLNVKYFNATTNQSSAKTCSLGDDIVIIVDVKNLMAIPAENLALNLKMPSGWELKNPRLYGTETNQDKFDYQDFKDDRVYTFFNLSANKNLSFTFKAKAAFSGNFFLPAVSCEAMYNGKIYARTASDRVIIK
ncbi:MAG: hypothetical protein H6567_01325 [Lewinellaceae bacterium]|nr:hypothetical protein [Lewinellaceae bacterium]